MWVPLFLCFFSFSSLLPLPFSLFPSLVSFVLSCEGEKKKKKKKETKNEEERKKEEGRRKEEAQQQLTISSPTSHHFSRVIPVICVAFHKRGRIAFERRMVKATVTFSGERTEMASTEVAGGQVAHLLERTGA